MLEQHHKSLTLNSQYFACIIKLKLRQSKNKHFYGSRTQAEHQAGTHQTMPHLLLEANIAKAVLRCCGDLQLKLNLFSNQSHLVHF